MDLRDYFRDELNYIKLLSKESANQNSVFRDFLSSFENDGDIEFLFENFAFLMAKLHQNIDDAFPEITQNLLSRVWPTPIRPVPSTSILRFFPKSADIHHIKKHSEVKSQSVDGESCVYRVVRDMSVVPLEVKYCGLNNTPNGCKITLKIKWSGTLNDDETWSPVPMTLFLSPDIQIARLLQLWFEQYLVKISVLSDGKEFNVSQKVIKNSSPDPDNLVLPLEISLFWRLQLLQQYLHLPHVNDFITLDIAEELSSVKLDEDGAFSVVFQFDTPLIINKTIDQRSTFFTNCVPIINLFQYSTPILDFVKDQCSYNLEIEDDNKIFQINAIYSPLEPARKGGRGGRIEYWPITRFTTNHFGHDNKIYYQTMFRHNVVGQPQNMITFIDGRGERVMSFPHESYICDVIATNGDKPKRLGVGDICLPTLTITNNLKFSNITKPTAEMPPLIDSHRHWQIISHLSLSPLFIRDINAIKQLIADLNYNAYLSAPLRQRCDKKMKGIVSVVAKLIDWIWDGLMKRGIEMTLELDPDCFEDEGDMYQFGVMLASVFPFCVTSNNFLMMKIVNSRTKKVWPLAPIKGSRDQI